MPTSLDKKNTLEEYYKNDIIAMKYRELYEGKLLETFYFLIQLLLSFLTIMIRSMVT
jgi:hypothetical protein